MEKIYVLIEITDYYGIDGETTVMASSNSMYKLKEKIYEYLGCDMTLSEEERDEYIEKNEIGEWCNTVNTIFLFEGYGVGDTVFRLEVAEIDYFEVKD